MEECKRDECRFTTHFEVFEELSGGDLLSVDFFDEVFVVGSEDFRNETFQLRFEIALDICESHGRSERVRVWRLGFAHLPVGRRTRVDW